MNFNKDYPIAILDTNIAISVPNILNILKGCNIVIPYTLIDELDKLKKEKKGARDFVNNFLAISENANLSKDGYKLENDCMLYVDRDNLSHKDVKLDSTAKKEDIKFIAVQKNLKEKYNDMEVVLISSDKIMKITASTFDVEVKFLEEFITEYLKDEFKLDVLFDLLKEYIESKDEENYDKLHEIIFKILSDSKDINGLYKLADNSYVVTKYGWNNIKGLENVDKYKKACQKMLEFLYNKIFEILSENKDIDGLYKLAESEDPDKTITVITDENKHIEVNFREEIYSEIFEILSENKDIDGLYKLAENEDPDKTITVITDENEKIEVNFREEIYSEIFEILSENKDINGLYELAKYYNNAYQKISEFLVNDKDIDGLFKLSEIYKSKEVSKRIFEILSENKDIDGLFKLAEIYKSEEVSKRIFEILSENKDIDGLYKLSKSYNSEKIFEKIFEIAPEQYNKYIDEYISELLDKTKKDYTYSYGIIDKEVVTIYERIFKILSENKDIKRLYEFFIKDGEREYNDEIENRMIVYEKMFEILIDKIEELENKK